MVDEQVIGAAYTSIKPDLRRLCEVHRVESAWVDQCGDGEQLLERVRHEIESLLGRSADGDDSHRRLLDLIQFTTLAAALHERASSSVAIRRRLEELERENRDLRSAFSGDAARPATGDADRDERLAETFRALSSLSHQINNPLTSLIGRSQLLRMSGGGGDERTAKAIRVIEESATRVAGYVRELALLVKESRERELGGE